MADKDQTREIVYEMLLSVEKEHVPSHILLSRTLAKYQYLDKKERAFLSRLFRGTLEQRIFLDAVIGQFSKTKLNKIKLPVRTILRMGVYQILMMDHVPDSAACDEAVKMAKRHGFKNLSGFVNGILRNISRDKEAIAYPEKEKEPAEYISMKYAMPLWLVKRWIAAYGYDRTEKMSAWMLQDQETSLRVRPVGGQTVEDVAGELENLGIRVTPGCMMPDAIRISGYDYLGDIAAFSEGRVTVQDESTMLSAVIADIHEGDRIIDVCAAPGGKSMHMADMLGRTGQVIARDLTEEKVSRITDNIERTHITNIVPQVMDATLLSQKDIESADIVMADLPCSGLGVIGRKPDIKLSAAPEKIAELASLQRQILSVVWQYVKKGGTLVYSTCTVDPEENQKNAEWFQEHFPFEMESLDSLIPEKLCNEDTKKGWIQIFPGEYGSDGFFVARFKRING